MKIIKSFVVLLISLSILLGASVMAAAAPAVGTTCYVDTHTSCVSSSTGNTYRAVNSIKYMTVRNDGTVCYCIEPGVVFTRTFYKASKPTENSTWLNMSAAVRESVALTAMFGFPSCTAAQLGVSSNHDAYAATQAIIWEYITGERTNPSQSMGSRGQGIKGTPAETAYWNGIMITLFTVLMYCLFTKKGYQLLSGYKTVRDKERGIEILPEGTHGTSGWMNKNELSEVLEKGDLDSLDETLFGKLDNGEYVSLKDIRGMNKNIIIYGSPGTGKSRGFVMPFALQAVKRNESLIMVDSQSINQSLQNFRYSGTPNLTDRPTDEKLQNILDNCELDIFSENIRIMITQAVERLYYTETLKVGNARLPQDKVRSYLNLLTSEVIMSVLQAMKNNEERIVNPMAYLMSTIINTICEQESDLILSLPKEYVNERDFYAPYTPFGSEGDDLDGTT